jgi:hypothetical protein
MSKRNSREAKAARREAVRQCRYPHMATGTCYYSAWMLAAAYPELRFAAGRRAISYLAQGVTRSVGHAWNVTGRGEVVDATMSAELREAVRSGRVTVQYADEGIRHPSEVVTDNGLAETFDELAARVGTLADLRADVLRRELEHLSRAVLRAAHESPGARWDYARPDR